MVVVYVIRSNVNGRRYVGMTNDLLRRCSEHMRPDDKAGQLLRWDFTVVLSEEYSDHESARRRERYLKSGYGRRWLSNKIGSSMGSASRHEAGGG